MTPALRAGACVLRLMPSDPEYAQYDAYVTALAALKNPCCHFDMQEIPEVERLAEIATIEGLLEEMAH